MPGGTNRPIVSDRDRFALLERQVADLQRTVANLLRPKPRTHWSQVRLARTIDDGDYPTGGQRFPIVFLDAVWDSVGEEVDLTAKSAEVQAYAHSVEPTTVPVDTIVFVEQAANGLWVIVDADHGVGIGETPTGGIAPGDSADVTAKILESDGTLSTALDESSDPILETVYNVFSSAIEEEVTIVYARDKRSGRLLAIAEDCPP